MELIGDGGIEVVIEDHGSFIRAVGPWDISKSYVVPYNDVNGNDTGVRYAMGTDSITGDTKIAYIDYPAPPYTVEDLKNNPVISKFFVQCNMCEASKRTREAIMKELGSSPVQAPVQSQVQVPVQSQVQAPVQVPARPTRLSVGDLGLPRVIPFAINFIKELWLSDLGKTGFSTAVALGAELLSSANPDPVYREEMQKLSDWAIDDVVRDMDARYVNNVRDDMSRFMQAYKKDRDLLGATLAGVVRTGNNDKQEPGPLRSSRVVVPGGRPSSGRGTASLSTRSPID